MEVPAVDPGTPVYADVVTLFGESASRVIVSVPPDRVADLLARASAASVPAASIGRVGGDRIRVSIEGRLALDESLAESEQIWSTGVERHFERARAIA